MLGQIFTNCTLIYNLTNAEIYFFLRKIDGPAIFYRIHSANKAIANCVAHMRKCAMHEVLFLKTCVRQNYLTNFYGTFKTNKSREIDIQSTKNIPHVKLIQLRMMTR